MTGVSAYNYYNSGLSLLGYNHVKTSLGDTYATLASWGSPGGIWGYPDNGPSQVFNKNVYIGTNTAGDDWNTGNIVVKLTVFNLRE